MLLPGFGLIGASVYLNIPSLLWVGLAIMLFGNIGAPWIMEVYASRKKAIRQTTNSEFPYDKKILTFVYTRTPKKQKIGPHQYKTIIPLDPPYELHPRYGKIMEVEYRHKWPLSETWTEDEGGAFPYMGFHINGKVVHYITADEVVTGPLLPRITNTEKGPETHPTYEIVEASGLYDMRSKRKSYGEIEDIMTELEADFPRATVGNGGKT